MFLSFGRGRLSWRWKWDGLNSANTAVIERDHFRSNDRVPCHSNALQVMHTVIEYDVYTVKTSGRILRVSGFSRYDWA